MRHEYAGFELAAFWLHVIIAVVLLMFLIRGKSPELKSWLEAGEESLTVEFSTTSILSEVTPQSSVTASTLSGSAKVVALAHRQARGRP